MRKLGARTRTVEPLRHGFSIRGQRVAWGPSIWIMTRIRRKRAHSTDRNDTKYGLLTRVVHLFTVRFKRLKYQIKYYDNVRHNNIQNKGERFLTIWATISVTASNTVPTHHFEKYYCQERHWRSMNKHWNTCTEFSIFFKHPALFFITVNRGVTLRLSAYAAPPTTLSKPHPPLILTS